MNDQGHDISVVELLKRRIQCALSRNDFDEAERAINTLNDSIGYDLELELAKARLFVAKKELNDARQVLLRALSVHRGNVNLAYELASVCEAQGDYDNAKLLYRYGRDLLKPSARQEINEGLARMERYSKKKVRKKISLVYFNHGGSNAIALFKRTPDIIKEKFDIQLVKLSGDFDYQLKTMDSDLVVATHFTGQVYVDQLILQLWHGFPLKAMGLMDKMEDHRSVGQMWSRPNYFTSYSSLYNTLINACSGRNINAYHITGAPRNDFLFEGNPKGNLEKLLGKHLDDCRLIFYMPTYRKRTSEQFEGNKEWNNVLGMRGLDSRSFTRFLADNNIRLIVKPHPHEEQYVLSKIESEQSDRILMLTDELLESTSIDLYETLGAIDLLITDYSSVYFDYLLLDRPIIFMPVDYDDYKERRGFLLEPYGFWTPGPKVSDQKSLENEILKSLNDRSYYSAERNFICGVVHEYKDNLSSERVWKLIEQLLVK